MVKVDIALDLFFISLLTLPDAYMVMINAWQNSCTTMVSNTVIVTNIAYTYVTMFWIYVRM